MPKSIILIGHIHDDHIPVENVRKIAEISITQDIKTSIGFEFQAEDIKTIKEQIKMTDLQKNYLAETNPSNKGKIKKEIIKSDHFQKLKNYLAERKLGNLVEKFDQYIGDNHQPDPYLQKCQKLYDINKSKIKLINSDYSIFHFDKDIEKHDAEVEEFNKYNPGKSPEIIHIKYEDERIQYMTKSILEETKKTASSDIIDEKQILLILVGYNHITRLQESIKDALETDSQKENCKIFSLRILPKEIEEVFNEDKYAKKFGDFDKLQEAMSQIPTLYHNDLRTISSEADQATELMKSAIIYAGGNGEKISAFISNKSGPLPSIECPKSQSPTSRLAKMSLAS